MSGGLMIGIISYLPNKDIRQKILDNHNRQLAWLHEAAPNIPIVVVSQNYTADDYSPLVSKYIDIEAQGIVVARNKMLSYFYSTDYDYIFNLDNDFMLYDYYNPASFMEELSTNPEKFLRMGVIKCLQPSHKPFKALNLAMDTEHNWIFTQDIGLFLNVCFIQNFKKHSGKEIYLHPMDATKGEGYEDMEFAFNATINHGVFCATCCNLIANNCSHNSLSVIFDSWEQRMSLHEQNKMNVVNMYKHAGFKINKQGRILIGAAKRFATFPLRPNEKQVGSFYLIPREHPYELADNLLPKPRKRKTATPTLF